MTKQVDTKRKLDLVLKGFSLTIAKKRFLYSENFIRVITSLKIKNQKKKELDRKLLNRNILSFFLLVEKSFFSHQHPFYNSNRNQFFIHFFHVIFLFILVCKFHTSIGSYSNLFYTHFFVFLRIKSVILILIF